MTSDMFAGISLTRLAEIDLRLTSSPHPEDQIITSYVLGIAQELAPDNETILRRRLRAATAAGQFELELELTRQLLKLDPTDTVLQLHLIRANLRSMQTVEERKAAYARLLDTESARAKIAAEVRSRLALEAAIMLRDNGDIDGFAERLKQSLELDPTHIDAALVAQTYYSSLIDDPVGKLDLLINLLLADPLNPAVRYMLANQLTAVGSFDAAIDAINKGMALSQTFGQAVTTDVLVHGQVMEWQVNGARSLVTFSNSRLASIRQQQLALLAVEEQTIDAKYITLTPEEEILRAVAARVAGDGASVDDAIGSLTALAELAQRQINAAQSGQPLPQTKQPATPEQLQQIVGAFVKARLDLHFAQLLVGSRVEQALAEHDAVVVSAAAYEQLDDYVLLCNALALLRNGQPNDAVALLEPHRERLAYAAIITVFAVDQLGSGDHTELRNTLLTRTALGNPASLPGAWARTMLLQEHPEFATLPLTPYASALDTLYNSIPKWVDELVQAPGRFLRLTAKPAKLLPLPLEPVEVELSLQNVGDIALGVGSDAVVRSGLSLIARTEVGMQPSAASQAPVGFSLDRRFKLLPGESITIKVWPEIGWAGWVIDTGASLTTRTRWRVLTSPAIDQQGNLRESPMSLSTQTDIVRRPALDTALLGFDAILERLRAGDMDSVPTVLAAIRSRISGPPIALGPPTKEHIDALGQILLERYPTMSWQDRCSVLFTIPSERVLRTDSIRQFDQFVKENENDPRVLAVIMLTRANFEDDRSITRSLASDNAELQRVAAAHRTRLQQHRGGYVVGRESALGIR
ncbi:MAG: hypothetical protein H6815_08615 [Phycisphaeraceae bacterium]|nr:hypothetical protein [Phycisphaerales bacterium]MCB9860504.1 hypothetical protein [Phycisphaeraceae bacterium]